MDSSWARAQIIREVQTMYAMRALLYWIRQNHRSNAYALGRVELNTPAPQVRNNLPLMRYLEN